MISFLDQKFSLVSFADSPYLCPARLWLKGTAEVSKYLIYSCSCNISGPAKTRMLLLPLTTGWLKSVLPGWLFKRCDCQTQPSSVYFLCRSSFPEIAVIFPGVRMLRIGQCFIDLPELYTRRLFYCSTAQRVSSHFFLCSHTCYTSPNVGKNCRHGSKLLIESWNKRGLIG